MGRSFQKTIEWSSASFSSINIFTNESTSKSFFQSEIKTKGSEIELFVVRWMDLESVIQSEVSQKEKNKYHMLTHIYGI